MRGVVQGNIDRNNGQTIVAWTSGKNEAHVKLKRLYSKLYDIHCKHTYMNIYTSKLNRFNPVGETTYDTGTLYNIQ